jgi:hypothetical protein
VFSSHVDYRQAQNTFRSTWDTLGNAIETHSDTETTRKIVTCGCDINLINWRSTKRMAFAAKLLNYMAADDVFGTATFQ